MGWRRAWHLWKLVLVKGLVRKTIHAWKFNRGNLIRRINYKGLRRAGRANTMMKQLRFQNQRSVSGWESQSLAAQAPSSWALAGNPEKGHQARVKPPGRNRNHGVDVATVGDTAQGWERGREIPWLLIASHLPVSCPCLPLVEASLPHSPQREPTPLTLILASW